MIYRRKRTYRSSLFFRSTQRILLFSACFMPHPPAHHLPILLISYRRFEKRFRQVHQGTCFVVRIIILILIYSFFSSCSYLLMTGGKMGISRSLVSWSQGKERGSNSRKLLDPQDDHSMHLTRGKSSFCSLYLILLPHCFPHMKPWLLVLWLTLDADALVASSSLTRLSSISFSSPPIVPSVPMIISEFPFINFMTQSHS